MNIEPLFSVIIPLFNKVGYIQSTLASVAAQTFTDFEVIVVDDGSTDGSASVAEAYSKIPVRLVRQANAGAAAARNHGAEVACGTYLAFLDADDQWFENHLLVMADLIVKYPNAKLYSSAYQFKYHRDGGPLIETNGASHEGLVDFFEEIRHYFLCMNSVVVAREIFKGTNMFPEQFKHGEDFAPLMELALKGPVAASLVVTSISDRDVPGQITRTKHAKGELRYLGYLPVLACSFAAHRHNRSFRTYAKEQISAFLVSRISWGYFHEFAQIYIHYAGRDAVPKARRVLYDLLLRNVALQYAVAISCRTARWLKRVVNGKSLTDIKECPIKIYRF
jgi:glycosyltransferase involved in cell wall biosynthesis